MASFEQGFGQGFVPGLGLGVRAGMNATNNRAAAERQQAGFDEARALKTFEARQSSVQEAYAYAAKAGSELINNGAPREKALAVAQKLIGAAANNADQMGALYEDFDAEAFKAKGQMILTALSQMPTPEEKAMSTGRAEAMGEVAGAAARAPFIGEEAARFNISGVEDAEEARVARQNLAVSRGHLNIAQRNASKPNVVNFAMPDGTFQAVDVSSPTASADVKDILQKGGARVGLNVAAETTGGINVGTTSNRDIMNTTSSAATVIDETDNLINSLADADTLTSLTGSGVRGLSSLAGNMVQFAQVLGGTAEGGDELTLLDPSKYSLDGFGDAASRSSAFQTNITNLAYSIARSREPGGRLSSQDVQNAIDSLAANSGDKDQIVASLEEIKRQTRTRYNNQRSTYESFTGTKLPPPPDKLMETNEQPQAQPQKSGGNAKSLVDKMASGQSITEEEFNALSAQEKVELKRLATERGLLK